MRRRLQLRNKTRKFKRLLAGPYLFWSVSFIIIPLLMIFYYGLTDKDGAFTLLNIAKITTPENLKALGLALLLSFVSTVICLLLAYPLAMILSNLGVNQSSFIVLIFILPMWMNFLLRTYSWLAILEKNGFLNQFFSAIGLFNLINNIFGTDITYFKMIGTSGAVVLGMVYNYLPFMILPIYSVIIKLDHSLLEAARDLGASSTVVFRRVIFPLSLPGILSGVTMVFVPSVSTFAISRLMGGGTQMMLGDLIELQFLGGAYNPYLGSAIALVMMVIVIICMYVMNRFGEGEEEAMLL